MVTFQEVPNIQIWGTITTTRKSSSNPKDTETVTMEAPGYEERVGLMLKNIRWSWTGWALLVAIFKLGSHKMVIRPWTKLPKIDPTKGVMPVAENMNATASPKDFKGATPKGQQALSCGVNPGARSRASSARAVEATRSSRFRPKCGPSTARIRWAPGRGFRPTRFWFTK